MPSQTTADIILSMLTSLDVIKKVKKINEKEVELKI